MPGLELGVSVITEWCTATVATLADSHLGIGAIYVRFRFLFAVIECFHRVIFTLICGLLFGGTGPTTSTILVIPSFSVFELRALRSLARSPTDILVLMLTSTWS